MPAGEWLLTLGDLSVWAVKNIIYPLQWRTEIDDNMENGHKNTLNKYATKSTHLR